jgi:hypothetical protein
MFCCTLNYYQKPREGEWIREYFFIGHDVKSVIAWRTSSPTSSEAEELSVRCDEEPSEAQIYEYMHYLQAIEWDEEKAKSEMK